MWEASGLRGGGRPTDLWVLPLPRVFSLENVVKGEETNVGSSLVEGTRRGGASADALCGKGDRSRPWRGLGTVGALGRNRGYGERKSPPGPIAGGGAAGGGRGARTVGGSMSGVTSAGGSGGARSDPWTAGCALSEGGIGSLRVGGGASSSGEGSLAGLKATTAAGEGSGEPGESAKAGSGPWEEGKGIIGAISGATSWARPGRM